MEVATTTTPTRPALPGRRSPAVSSFSNEQMQIADFALERYFARWEFAAKHVLCASDCEPLALAELLEMADDDSRERWTSLRLGYTESLGLPALRDSIAGLYDGVTADEIITFAG